MSAAKRHANDFVSGSERAVPRSVKGHKRTATIFGRKHVPFVESDPERRGVRLDEQCRHGCARDEITAFASSSRIFMLAKIRVRPAVKGAGSDVGDVVRNELIAESVAFIDCRPERTRR